MSRAGLHHRVQSSLGPALAEARICRKHLLPLQGENPSSYESFLNICLDFSVRFPFFVSVGHWRPVLPQSGTIHCGKVEHLCQSAMWVCCCARRPHWNSWRQVLYEAKTVQGRLDFTVSFSDTYQPLDLCSFVLVQDGLLLSGRDV